MRPAPRAGPFCSAAGRADKKRGGGFPKEARRLSKADDKGGYFSADRAVSTDSLTMNVAPHHLEPGPPGLIGVLETPSAV